MGRVGMDKLDTQSSKESKFRDSMFGCWIHLCFAVGLTRSVAGCMRDRRISVYGSKSSSHLSLGRVVALLGSVCGVFGANSKNPLRWKAPALSTFLLLLWVAQAIGE